MLTAVVIGIGCNGPLMGDEIPPSSLSEDSHFRSDRPAGWVHETLGNISMLRYHTGPTHQHLQANVADLVSAISDVPSRGPLPLGVVFLSDYLRHSPALQTYLSDQIEAKHQKSLLKAMARPRMMPIQGVDDAPPLQPIALDILKDAPQMKEIQKALEVTGYRIKNITWDQFQVMEGADQLLFLGNVILHLEPLPGK